MYSVMDTVMSRKFNAFSVKSWAPSSDGEQIRKPYEHKKYLPTIEPLEELPEGAVPSSPSPAKKKVPKPRITFSPPAPGPTGDGTDTLSVNTRRRSAPGNFGGSPHSPKKRQRIEIPDFTYEIEGTEAAESGIQTPFELQDAQEWLEANFGQFLG